MASAASAVSTKGTRPSMESFLQESRRALLRFAQTCKSPAMGEDTFTIVMGNEAFDMDSNICSLVHAFAIAHRSGKENIAPFFPILRSEFDIRLGSCNENLFFPSTFLHVCLLFVCTSAELRSFMFHAIVLLCS